MNAPQTAELSSPSMGDLASMLDRLLANVGSVVLGKPDVIRLAVVALLAEGHILIEDVPGVGKTLLARAIAANIECTFKRIQFTPDLLPSDILGSSVYNAASGEFVFKPGPIFANVILADEINRTTPRTQSALLEAMSDTQVSVEGKTYPPQAALHRDGDPEPLRVRGDLRPPREPARPVHDPPPDGLPAPVRGAQGALDQPPRQASRSSRSGPS